MMINSAIAFQMRIQALKAMRDYEKACAEMEANQKQAEELRKRYKEQEDVIEVECRVVEDTKLLSK